MKIVIKSKQELKHRVFYFPLFFIKTRWGMRLFAEITGISFENKAELKQTLTAGLKKLKAFIKANGHFNCVEVHSTSGEDVIIRL